METIELHEPSDEFARCWNSAGRHIDGMVQDSFQGWLKADLIPPFLEHLSFMLGNQLFFVRVEDVDGRMSVPGNISGVLSIADGCKGHACLMPMRFREGVWVPDAPGWGLLDARTRQPIDPVAFVTGEKIEMTDWELQDFSVQAVCNHIDKKLGYKLMSWQGNPQVNPSIWFVGDHGPVWVVVRGVRYPEKEAVVPSNIQEIAKSCSHMSKTGNFASVAVCNADDSWSGSATPLWRGHAMYINFEGLVSAVVH